MNTEDIIKKVFADYIEAHATEPLQLTAEPQIDLEEFASVIKSAEALGVDLLAHNKKAINLLREVYHESHATAHQLTGEAEPVAMTKALGTLDYYFAIYSAYLLGQQNPHKDN